MAHDPVVTLHVWMSLNDGEPIDVGEIEFQERPTYDDFNMAVRDMFRLLAAEMRKNLEPTDES